MYYIKEFLFPEAIYALICLICRQFWNTCLIFFQCVFSNLGLYLKSVLKNVFFHSFYFDIIDVEQKGVLNFIWHLKGHILIPLFLGVHHLLQIQCFCLVYCH